MKVLILGASGATGRLVVQELINRNIETRLLIRRKVVMFDGLSASGRTEIIKGNIDEIPPAETRTILRNCDAVVCCLGHNIDLKGIYGKPHKLVYNAIRKIVETLNVESGTKKKLVLMSTTAYTNAQIGEKNTIGEKIALGIIGALLPPHQDNVSAVGFLINGVGKNEKIEWVAVRPDTLIDKEKADASELYASPIRSPIFNSGKTSRANVAHFIAELLTDERLWQEWKFKTPVIYDKG